MSVIRNRSLAAAGLEKIAWVKDFMPVLAALEKRFEQAKPFAGRKISVCVHLEAKTAYFCQVLRAGGAEVRVTGSNPLSTKDEICAALDSLGFDVFAWFGATEEEYREHIRLTLENRPNIIIDDGGDFVQLLHGEHPEYASELLGGCEETTTGLHRLRARERAGTLRFPMIAVNDANCKYLFDNHHGTGQSTWDAIMYTTNNMVSGRTVVIAGYGHCGSGIALRAKGLGANVIVTEVNPYRALEALMDGYRVMTMDEAAPLGDIFVTATGCKDVIVGRHFKGMKHNAILANSGHFDVEVNKNDLGALCGKIEQRKPFIDGYYLTDGRILNVLADGRLVNVVAGNGHPADIMDLSFSIQALCAQYLAESGKGLKNALYNVPERIDHEIAMLKLGTLGVKIDALSEEQKAYLYGG
ncbi:MAG: adenosylhomocysteinase [Bacillota bacterium]